MTLDQAGILVSIVASVGAFLFIVFGVYFKVKRITDPSEDASVPGVVRDLKAIEKRVGELEHSKDRSDDRHEELTNDFKELKRSLDKLIDRVAALTLALSRKGVSLKPDPDPRDS